MITIQLSVHDSEDAKTLIDLARIMNPKLSSETFDALSGVHSIGNVLSTLLERYVDDLDEDQFHEILEAFEILDRMLEGERLGLKLEK